MAIKLDLDMGSVVQARAEVEKLYEEYNKLKQSISSYQEIVSNGNRLTITQAKELENLQKEMKSVNSSITEYDKAIDNIDPEGITRSFKDIYGSAIPLNTEMRRLTQQMQMMTLAGEENSEQFAAVSNRMTEIQGAMDRANQSISALGANRGIHGISTQVGMLGKNILSLNFEGAAKSANSLTATMEGMDIKKTADDIKNFGKAITGTLVKALKTGAKMVWQFTASLLANPITWIVVGVLALVAGLYTLLKAFGKLDETMEKINASLQWIVDLVKLTIKAFKDFTDYLGITNFAEMELAEARKKRADDELENVTKVMDAKNHSLSRELKILQANGVNTKEEIENERRLTQTILHNEKEKTKAKAAAVKAEVDLLLTKKKLSDDEKQKLKEQQQALIDLSRTIDNINDDIKVNNIKANDKMLANDKKYNDERAAINKKANEDRLKEEKRINDLRLKAKETIDKIDFKLTLENLENKNDKVFKELEKSLIKERDLLLSNETLTEEERIKIKDYFTKLIDDADKSRMKQNAEDEKAETENRLSNTLKIENMFLQKRKDLLDKDRKDSLDTAIKYNDIVYQERKNSLAEEQKDILKDKTLTEEQIIEINRYYDELSKDELAKYKEDENNIRKEFNDKDIQDEKDKWIKLSKIVDAGFNSTNLGYAKGVYDLTRNLSSGLTEISEMFDDEAVSNAEKAAAIATFAISSVSSVIDEISNKRKEAMESMLREEANALKSSQDNVDRMLKEGLLSQEEADKQKYDLAMASFRKEEEIKKKAFEADKKAKIAQASIAMVQGMVSAYMGAQTIPLAGPAIGAILAAAVGAMGIINIKKIKDTKYESGTAPSLSTGGSVSIGDVSDPRSLIETGEDNRYSQNSDRVMPVGTQSSIIDVNATVSVSELESTQNKVDRYKSNSEL